MNYYFSDYGKTAFTLCGPNDEKLFAFGEGYDVCVYKEEMKKQSYCQKASFNYKYNESLIQNGKIKTSFIPKKFAVIQMNKR